jgi:tRNA pseudouridine55 synthase
VDGILVIDKPSGITSHDVVARVRRILRTKRVGHTGTLDPFATGVMVILVGKATRLAQFLDKDKKEYIADVQFGSETDTGDLEGSRIAECGMRIEDLTAKLRDTDFGPVIAKFRGEIMQTPPMYSAKKIEGKKLYELARAGKEVERKPNRVVVSNIELLPDETRDPQSATRDQSSTIRIRVACSAGTYIRTLATDIGRAVGVGAHLTALRRTAAGKFNIEQAISLEELQALDDPTSVLLPTDKAVTHLQRFDVPDERLDKTKGGLSTRVFDVDLQNGQFVRMIASDESMIAIGVYDETEKSIRPKIVLI